jgi:ribulose-5-phosphate 4-epimerase/fuculose-1-phosphate aldolase
MRRIAQSHLPRKGPSSVRSSSVASLVEDTVTANRILAQHGVLDAYGHVSVRHPQEPGHFLLSRSMAPELVTESDIMEFGLDGKPVGRDLRRPHLETPIHSEIYKARPDVMAIVHSHAPAVIPFCATTVPLRPIYHMSSFLSADTPVFDIRKKFGCTDMLVREPEQGAALGATLGKGRVALMRGHGFVTAGDTLPLVVFQAIYTSLNASLLCQAISLGGEITYLESDEAELAWETNRASVSKPWEMWTRNALRRAGEPARETRR